MPTRISNKILIEYYLLKNLYLFTKKITVHDLLKLFFVMRFIKNLKKKNITIKKIIYCTYTADYACAVIPSNRDISLRKRASWNG